MAKRRGSGRATRKATQRKKGATSRSARAAERCARADSARAAAPGHRYRIGPDGRYPRLSPAEMAMAAHETWQRAEDRVQFLETLATLAHVLQGRHARPAVSWSGELLQWAHAVRGRLTWPEASAEDGPGDAPPAGSRRRVPVETLAAAVMRDRAAWERALVIVLRAAEDLRAAAGLPLPPRDAACLVELTVAGAEAVAATWDGLARPYLLAVADAVEEVGRHVVHDGGLTSDQQRRAEAAIGRAAAVLRAEATQRPAADGASGCDGCAAATETETTEKAIESPPGTEQQAWTFDHGIVSFNGQRLPLPPGHATDMLTKLAKSVGRVVPHGKLSGDKKQQIASDTDRAGARSIRSALKGLPFVLVTIRGRGYLLRPTTTQPHDK